MALPILMSPPLAGSSITLLMSSPLSSNRTSPRVKMECHEAGKKGHEKTLKKIKHNEVMKTGCRIYVPVSVAESRISKRFDTIPTASLCPNADEIQYLQRLVMYKDSAILVLNKPPKVPLKGNMAVHNSMDALAASALCYDYDDGPKLVHRLDRESSGILLMGRSKESISYLHYLFSNINTTKSSLKASNDKSETTYQKYWALVIGTPKEKQGVICAPLTKVVLNGGKAERVMLSFGCGLETSQEALTEYRVMGPTINGCSWLELQPLTNHKHQIRVHCAEALGTPIVGDYKYGWFVHSKWKQIARVDYEPISGEPYKMRRPDGLDVQKGSVLSKVPLLHLHCRELVVPNVAKNLEGRNVNSKNKLKPDVLRFVASMPSHMKIRGHTAEMINLLSVLQPDRFSPRFYIAAATDNMSLQKARVFENSLNDKNLMRQVCKGQMRPNLCRYIEAVKWDNRILLQLGQHCLLYVMLSGSC
ncbi:hypothetical protein L2E82_22796 [Cichorium intybus]|uniref:Uncharacterized protein n=1 Tax=Cichorium intybus TaxID=13427 RepID=A0ACB9DZ60_CICIN|nr:hypothetical protein L2E82_22796 [Cichorium intybus]